MTRIKICGITNLVDALKAVELGADAVGFVFADSPRRIGPDRVRTISTALPPFVSRVGVFVDEKFPVIKEMVKYCRLDIVQLYESTGLLHDTEFIVPVIRAFRVENRDILDAIEESKLSCFLMDTHDPDLPGGTGRCFDWDIAGKAAKLGKVILSGGLNPANIVDALEAVRPYAVDVSSGVEKNPGIKDPVRMKLFVDEVKNWDSRTN
ncbi:MAG: phosphoribosylanthranilate isomerase [Candidatus Zixiibacteriota bacterium]|nr:MAG: phosphoribosylanthranilate isomerase [candidate division Zixibacteria bacterium]